MRLRLERLESAARAWRGRALGMERDLFRTPLLVREWGPIGVTGGGRAR